MGSSQPTKTDTASVKCCAKCGETKSVEEFSRRRSNKEGRQSYCKPCQRAAYRQWFKGHPGARTEYDRKWRESNPEKVAASMAKYTAHRAVRRARLTRAARYFAQRPGWEHVVFRVLTADSQCQSHCYYSPDLEALYQKHTEKTWDE